MSRLITIHLTPAEYRALHTALGNSLEAVDSDEIAALYNQDKRAITASARGKAKWDEAGYAARVWGPRATS
jgi:hypothetical protein